MCVVIMLFIIVASVSQKQTELRSLYLAEACVQYIPYNAVGASLSADCCKEARGTRN